MPSHMGCHWMYFSKSELFVKIHNPINKKYFLLEEYFYKFIIMYVQLLGHFQKYEHW